MEVAKSALFMAQKQLDVTGHNIANVDTTGFTRQRIVQQAIDPYGVMTRLKDMENGKVGAGVLTHSLDQIRDQYLDRRIRNHNETLGYWSERYDGMYEIESLFNAELGASKTSLTKITTDFFNAVDKLSGNEASGDREVRTNLVIAANQLTSIINDIYIKLEELQYEHELIVAEPNSGLVAQVNKLMDSIADYNKQIYAFEVNNYNSSLPHEKALDLRDQRNLLLDELSTLIDMDYYEDAESKLHISIAGFEMVNHDKAEHLELRKVKTNPLNGKENDLSIVCWVPPSKEEGSYMELVLTGGKIKAHLDLRDGQKSEPALGFNSVSGIPQIVEELNLFVRTLAKEFNALHEQGYTFPHDENGRISQTGFQFFEVPTDGYDALTIANFRLSAQVDPDREYIDSNGDKVRGSVYNVAISAKQLIYGDPMLEEANNEIGLKLKELLYKDIDGVGALNKFINTFLVMIGSETAVAKSRFSEYESIAYELQQMFMSYSGVSNDEEMTNIIRFNHSYTAASRVITTIDEQLDVLINRMGRVGL